MSWVWRELAYNRASAKHPSFLPAALDSSLDNRVLSNGSFLNTCLFQRKWNPVFFCFHLHSALGFEAGCISDFKEMGRSKTIWGLIQTEGSQGTLGPAIRSPRLLSFKEAPRPPDFCLSLEWLPQSLSESKGRGQESKPGCSIEGFTTHQSQPWTTCPFLSSGWGVCVCVCVCVCVRARTRAHACMCEITSLSSGQLWESHAVPAHWPSAQHALNLVNPRLCCVCVLHTPEDGARVTA